jgi:hypothetical protein
MELRPGRYRHYKGNDYLVLDVVKHSETEAELVLYRALYGETQDQKWVRPLEMFTEQVELSGILVPRFKFIEP